MANCPLGKAKPDSHFQWILILWPQVTILIGYTLILNIQHVALQNVDFFNLKSSSQYNFISPICQNIKITEIHTTGCPSVKSLTSLNWIVISPSLYSRSTLSTSFYNPALSTWCDSYLGVRLISSTGVKGTRPYKFFPVPYTLAPCLEEGLILSCLYTSE